MHNVYTCVCDVCRMLYDNLSVSDVRSTHIATGVQMVGVLCNSV